MGFYRQEYWSGLPFPSGDLPNPGIEPRSSALQANALTSEPPGKPKKKVKSLRNCRWILGTERGFHWTASKKLEPQEINVVNKLNELGS